MLAAVCCGLAASCQYLQQQDEPPKKDAPWSTAYGGNGPLPGSIPECSTDFECKPGEYCVDRKCTTFDGGDDFDAGSTLPCPDPEGGKSGVLRPYVTPGEGVEARCGQQLVGPIELGTMSHVSTGFGQFYGALDAEEFGVAAACGACIEITREGMPPVESTVVDECADCAPGDVTLSEFGLGALGVAPGEEPSVSWRYIACPTTEVVSFQLEDPAAVPAAVRVQGHLFRITSLEADVAGSWEPATRRPDNYWVLPPGALSASMYRVRATDINGSVVEAALLLVPEEQYSDRQFPSCQ